MKIAFTKPGLPGTGVVVVGAAAGGKFTPAAEQLDKKTGGMISRAVKSSRFKGEKGQSLNVPAPSGTRLESAVLVGLGKPEEMTVDRAQELGGEIYALVSKSVTGTATVCVDKVSGSPISAPEMAANIGHGARLRSYRFDKYRTKEKKEDKPSLKSSRSAFWF